MPNVGDPASDFSCPANDGQTYTLSQFRGKNAVVLVFYPGDETPTCTAQLCDYRDGWGQFQQLGAVVFGINTNSLSSHQKFSEKFSFPFPLLEDTDLTVCRAYDALMFPEFLRIARRAVYIIDREGIIRYKHVETLPLFRRTKEELLEALKGITA